jgi:hypothetical protein
MPFADTAKKLSVCLTVSLSVYHSIIVCHFYASFARSIYIYFRSRSVDLTKQNRVLYEKLKVPHLSSVALLEHGGLLLCSRRPATGLYPQEHELRHSHYAIFRKFILLDQI